MKKLFSFPLLLTVLLTSSMISLAQDDEQPLPQHSALCFRRDIGWLKAMSIPHTIPSFIFTTMKMYWCKGKSGWSKDQPGS
jgi:hypothetical protein